MPKTVYVLVLDRPYYEGGPRMIRGFTDEYEANKHKDLLEAYNKTLGEDIQIRVAPLEVEGLPDPYSY